METILNREDLHRDLEDTLYEIIVGGHICLIGKAGYIDWMCGGDMLCMSSENNGKNITKL